MKKKPISINFRAPIEKQVIDLAKSVIMVYEYAIENDQNINQLKKIIKTDGDTTIEQLINVLYKNSINITEVDEDYTVTINDCGIFVDCTSGDVTLSLPALAPLNKGKVFYIKKVDASANSVIIEPDGAETIDGDANYSTNTQYETNTIVSRVDEWSKL